MPTVSGRGFRCPTYSVDCMAGGVFLRVDDDLDAERWFTVFIPWEEVDQWKANHAALRELIARLEEPARGVRRECTDELPSLQLPDLPIPEIPFPDLQPPDLPLPPTPEEHKP